MLPFGDATSPCATTVPAATGVSVAGGTGAADGVALPTAPVAVSEVRFGVGVVECVVCRAPVGVGWAPPKSAHPDRTPAITAPTPSAVAKRRVFPL